MINVSRSLGYHYKGSGMKCLHSGLGLRSWIMAVTLPFLFTGCGSSKDPSSVSGPMAGNWQMSLLPSTNIHARSQSGFLQQNGNTISGSLLLVDSPCSGVGSATGTAAGNNVSLVVAPVGVQITLTGTSTSNPSSMSGNYTLISTGCQQEQTSPQTGTWTASLVAPMNGTISTGSFASTRLNTSYTLGGTVTQGPNTGLSNTSVSGSFSFSASTPYCFSGLTMSGVISGTSVTLNLLDSTNTQQGEINGTLTLDGTSFTGSYKIMPQNNQPCVAGDEGTVTFTL